MPELPEVETTCRGIRPHLEGSDIRGVQVLERRLRWRVAEAIEALAGQSISAVERRAKYILIQCTQGTLLIHLGMSGSLRLCEPSVELRKHDHIILKLSSGLELRFHDPRRFGCWLWHVGDVSSHPLLRDMGPEPLADVFNFKYLSARCSGRRTTIKQLIMDAKVVVGVGNIYACEALFEARIDPSTPAGLLDRNQLRRLITEIRKVLRRSIEQGGTTLRDFLREDDQPGYFKQQLMVYDREGQPCRVCGTPIIRQVQGQRSTFFCPECQRLSKG
jgi:formamidopyrimidine-DNA glycosylase